MLQDRTLDRSTPVPLYFQLKTLILDEIKNGSYQSGDRIPTENELSEMFGISRTAVRQAITELVHEGRLFRIKSKGTFVAQEKMTQNYLNRYFSYDETAAASGKKTVRLQLLKEIVPMPQVMIDLGSGIEGDKVIHLKRKRLLDGIPSARIDAYLVCEPFKDVPDDELTNHSLREIMDRNPETRDARTVRIIEAVPATKEDINELDVEPGSAIQKMTTIRYNEAEKPLCYSIVYHRADLSRIELEIINPKDEPK